MFGKIHQHFFDSSINDEDPVTRLVFIGMITLSDKDGRIDFTPQALARRLNLEHRDVEHALEALGAPDERSRSSAEGGRRIVPMDQARSWGWIVVNKAQYRDGRELGGDERREQERERKRRQRERDALLLQTSSSPNTDTDTPGVTVTQSHSVSRSRHAMSHKKRDMEAFERLWEIVPRREGRADALKHFNAFLSGSCKADPDKTYRGDLDRLVADLEKAIRNYSAIVKAEGTERRYIKQGSGLFFNFRDYVEPLPPTTTPGFVSVPLGGQSS